MTFNILTLFPNLFSGFLNETIIARAIKQELLQVNLIDIRAYAPDRHNTVDDSPYGGGAGMVMKVEPIYNALLAHDIIQKSGARNTGHYVSLFSPRGTSFSQRMVQQFAHDTKILTLICGRYEGIDQRVTDNLVDQELSIGPYVLSGGEVPSMVVMEAVSRLIPGVLGNPDSLKEETFTLSNQKEYPQYTKPESFFGWSVPEILLSGNHEKIREWRDQNRQTPLDSV